MTKKTTLAILLTTLWACLTLLGGCSPQAGNSTSMEAPPSQPASGEATSTQATPTPGPQPLESGTTISLPPEQPTGAQEGILVKFGSYTDGEEKWAVLHREGEQDTITLLTVTPEISVTGGPLKEGQRVAVTCQEILTIYPSLFYQVSAVEVLGELSPEEWEETSATVDSLLQSLGQVP